MSDEERRRKFEQEEKMRGARLLLDMYEKYGSRIMEKKQEEDAANGEGDQLD